MQNKFLEFIIERENIRIKKENGEDWPWTDDPILKEFSFTNVKRKNDKTSKAFIKLYKEYGKSSTPEICLLNCAMNRQFGTIDFAESVGWQHQWNEKTLINSANIAKDSGKKIFTGAYMVTAAGKKGSKIIYIAWVLDQLWPQLPALAQEIKITGLFQSAHDLLRKSRGFGGSGFMAKEMLLDSMFCESVWKSPPIDNETWTGVGPGSTRGVKRVLEIPLDERISEKLVLETIKEVYDNIKGKWPHEEKLEIHDIQFQMCEFDKYMRVKNGNGRPRKIYNNTLTK